MTILPEGGGETTRSPKLTESLSSSSLKVAAFHTKSYFSLTCSSRDVDLDGFFELFWLLGSFFRRRIIEFLTELRKMLFLVSLPRPRLKPPFDHEERFFLSLKMAFLGASTGLPDGVRFNYL